MILVKTKIGPSRINGIGIFADENIPKGSPIWSFQHGFDLIIDESELSALSPSAKVQFLKYAYKSTSSGKYVLCFDDARFFNHSDNPNCINADDPRDPKNEGINLAGRDIVKDEELTCDYRTFDLDFEDKLTS